MNYHPLTYDNVFRINISQLGERLDEATNFGKKQPIALMGITSNLIQIAPDYYQVHYELFGSFTLITHHSTNVFYSQTTELHHNRTFTIYSEGEAVQLKETPNPRNVNYSLDFLERHNNEEGIIISKQLAQFFLDWGATDLYHQPITSKNLPLFNSELTSDKDENDNIYAFNLRRLALYLTRQFALAPNEGKDVIATDDLEIKRFITFDEMNAKISYKIYEFIQNLTTIYTLDIHMSEYGEHVYKLSSNERFHHIGMKASDDPIPVELLPVNLEDNHCLFQTLDGVTEQSYMSRPLFNLLTSSKDILNLNKTKGE